MFALDMPPDLPPQYAQVMLVQTSKSQQAKSNYDRTIGVCQAIENPPHPDYPQGSAVNSVSPIHALRNYFSQQEARKLEGPSSVTVLELPRHGEFKDRGTLVTRHGVQVDTGERRYRYLPNPDYLGKDSAVLLVDIAGMKIRVVYSFHVVESIGNDTSEILCGRSRYKRLSLPSNAYPVAPQNSGQLTSFLSGAVRVNMADEALARGAAGHIEDREKGRGTISSEEIYAVTRASRAR